MSNELVRHQPHSQTVSPQQLAFPSQDPWGTPQMTPNAPPSGSDSNPVKMLHRSLRGRYPLAITLGLAGASLGAILGWTSQGQTYRAMASVQFDGSYVVDPIGGGRQTTPFFNQRLSSEATKFVSDRTVETAITSSKWQAEGDLKDLSDTNIREFTSRIGAAVATGASHIVITFEHANPKVAVVGVNAIVDAYVQNFRATNSETVNEEVEKTRKTLKETERKRDQLNEDIARINNELRVADVPKALEQSQTRVATLTIDLREESRTMQYMQIRRNALDKAAPVAPTFEQLAKTDQTFASFYDLYNERLIELMRLEGTLGANNPRVTKQRKETASLRLTLEKMVDTLGNGKLLIVPAPDGQGSISVDDVSIENQKAKLAFAQQLLEDENQLSQRLSEANARLSVLTADRKTAENNIANFVTFLTRTGGAQSSGTLFGLVDQLRAATANISNDRRQKVAMFGGAVGFCAPIALMLLFGLFDRRYRYSDEAVGSSATKGVTLLGILPNLPDRLSDPNQASIAAHCVHQIRTMLQLNSIGDEPAAIAVTSAASGDGKTSLSLALGLSFAASGSRTLLIDADIIGAGLSARLGVSEADGIGEAILSRNILDFVRETDVADLSILGVGTATPIQASTFSPQLVRRLLTELKKSYDVLVIDTGPLMGSIEATPIVATADTVILAVSRGQNRDLVEQAITHLKSIGARLAGVVFNRANARDFEKSISGISLRSVARTVPGQQAARAAAMNSGANPIISSMQADSSVTSHMHGSHAAGHNGSGNGTARH